jgi:hypothetical protein
MSMVHKQASSEVRCGEKLSLIGDLRAFSPCGVLKISSRPSIVEGWSIPQIN